jgi:hypothetical protein
MFFELPPANFLSRAFTGYRAWNEQRDETQVAPGEPPPAAHMPLIDKPGATFDGFTLYAREKFDDPAGLATQAYLINMDREQVYRWAVPFSKIWPAPPHIVGPVRDSGVSIFACHLEPNGDLLVIFHGEGRAAAGFGLAKLDKDSNILWKYAAATHHDVDVGEDGTIYAIAHEMVDFLPPGLEFVRTPCLIDYVLQLSPNGKELRKPISILEAFRDSRYAALLAAAGRPVQRQLPQGLNLPRFLDNIRTADILHTNSVKVLRREQASQFPGLKAGQLLLSIRQLDALAVLDPESRAIVWAARGPWRAQHDAQFLANGHLLIFDNLGAPQGSRVLEYDPRTQAIPWSYPDTGINAFFSGGRGMAQRLPNGNTLIVSSWDGDIFEVSSGGEVVWSCPVAPIVSTARRYAAHELPFLNGRLRARR